MKKIVILSLFLANISVFSQVKALTEDGKDVVLLENGTWKFVNESDAALLETIETNSAAFEKSKTSTFLLKSKRINVGIYINPKVWKPSTKAESPFVEYMFNSADQETLFAGFFLTEKVQIGSLKNLKDIVIANIQKNADYFRLIKSEYRNVNGLKVLYLRYSANAKGIDFEYAAQYYIDSEGYCGVAGFSPKKNFDKNAAQIQELLNGLVQVEKGETFSSPPPPMRP
ncbi:hypothetical protein [Kaistella palustris]|uniref:hypothetical protein n=1 Tax=Kaistella palustris TaxID=493376 RepID=UPI0004250190|nr:hypothetical protein [Kaistella palustris]